MIIASFLIFTGLVAALTMWLTRNEDWGGSDRPRFRWPRRADPDAPEQAI